MTGDVTTVARGISEFGMMAMTAAFFLVLSGLLWWACFKWLKSTVDDVLKGNSRMVQDLLIETRKQNDMLNDISEGLRPETLLRIKNLTGAHFDLGAEKALILIGRIKEENHIDDRERTRGKIKTLLANLHEDRKSKFDSFSWQGRKGSEYANPEWIEWVAEIVESEVYDPDQNKGRARTNIKAIYDKIKVDFYNRLTKIRI